MNNKTINVSVENNLNAIVHGGTNVNARVTFESSNLQNPFTTPEIPGGRGYGPFQLHFDANIPELTISVGANTLPNPQPLLLNVPEKAIELLIDLRGTQNGQIDIQYKFVEHV